MRENLAALISREVKDPRVRKIGMVSVNHVELNRDMSIATVFVSFLGAEPAAAEAAVQGLEAAAGFLRGPLARSINLSRAPRLRFQLDDAAAFNARLTEIVRADAESHRDEDTPDDTATGTGRHGGEAEE
jgi:ribosome-binding factor A